MLNFLNTQNQQCRQLWTLLDNNSRGASVEELLTEAPAEVRAHFNNCDECHKRVEELITARQLLSVLPASSDISRPWFASRVMAAIAARENELSGAANAWTLVPKLASRLAWISALATILVFSFFYQRPKPAQFSTEPAGETLLDNAPAPVVHDDVLASLTEREQ